MHEPTDRRYRVNIGLFMSAHHARLIGKEPAKFGSARLVQQHPCTIPGMLWDPAGSTIGSSLFSRYCCFLDKLTWPGWKEPCHHGAHIVHTIRRGPGNSVLPYGFSKSRAKNQLLRTSVWAVTPSQYNPAPPSRHGPLNFPFIG